MIKRFAALLVVMALVCTVSAVSAFAGTPTDTDSTGKPVATLPASAKPSGKELQPNEKLRAGLVKLVSDTKAGKVKLAAPSQMAAKRNNLSKGTKIAIGVGVAAVVVLAIVVIHAKNHFFDDFRPFAQ